MELLRLKGELDNLLVKNTPEGKWLITSLNSAKFNNITRIIFISNNTWRSDNTQRYADNGIGLMNTAGMIQAPKLLTVLIHEMNVNKLTDKYPLPFLLPEDTHMPPAKTKEVWLKSNNFSVFSQVLNNVNSVDELYQTYCCINALILALILSGRNTELETV